jgi:hypothetical protein
MFDTNCILPAAVLGFAVFVVLRSARVIRQTRVVIQQITDPPPEIVDGVVMDSENRNLLSLYWWADSPDWKDKDGNWHRFKR